ncbi:CaiB/BaiF CoA transferase family protein [Clostridium botulinum]|uniref:CaiB/BaiF CoA transferase family protein n=1 Tax=Clostridium botulinum TaxID=1491 RepID=UPI0006ABFBBD|nr:CaiB/BaiF CoA-transferase family protein [Clostridium botulinum]AWB30840.1 CoA transferase [Clostridium botulinum]KOR54584.1 carnitine dehydratase [Clostridium botulinum]MBY6829917.1 CoA transferase [Clostridium botulinum]MBY6908442.1 CoA transferase [Clostridium botulinum]MBY6924390.1 CoA transferase [Clostridium botulinum]
MTKEGLALEGVKVVELSSFVAAPSCSKLLADWGADVIKIEPIQGDNIRVVGGVYNSPARDDENPMFELENGNKRGIAINTRSEKGKEVLGKLLKDADVFVTNVREKALQRSGLSYDQLKDKYPSLIHAHILGYGEKGPLKDKPGFDYTAYFARGAVSTSLMEKGTSPANTNAGFGDHYAGMSLAAGILAALHRKTLTGKGDRVTVSLYHTAIFGMGLMITTAQYGNKMPLSRRTPNNPLATTYRCKDDRWIQLALLKYDAWFPKFCKEVINRPDLIEDSRFNKQSEVVKHVETFVGILEGEFIKKDLKEWADLLDKADLPYEKLQYCENILEDEQAWANDYLFKTTYDSGNTGVLVNSPVKFSEAGMRPYKAAPKIGEDTEVVLTSLGYSKEEIEEMRKEESIK